jgi:hypothetical protein
MNLSYFYQKNSEGDVLIDSNNAPLLRERKTKQLAVLQAHIEKCSDIETINRVCRGVIELDQWQWFDEYHKNLVNLDQVNAFNANLPVISQDENGDVLAEAKDLPTEPVRPTLLTVDEFKTANKVLFDSYNKKQGVEINGYQVSLNKDNSDGLVSIKAGYDLVGDAIFPTNFIADNATGTVSIKLNDYEEFTNFALQFLAERNALFN